MLSVHDKGEKKKHISPGLNMQADMYSEERKKAARAAGLKL